LEEFDSYSKARCIETHKDFKPDAKIVVGLLLNNPGYYAYFFFHSGPWARKFVRAESTVSWAEDAPEDTWPMFIWDELERVDTLEPDANWYDGIWNFEDADDYEDLREFDDGNAEYVMEHAAGKWRSSMRGRYVTRIGEEIRCGAGQFNTGPGEVLAKEFNPLRERPISFLIDLTAPFDERKISLSLCPIQSKTVWVPLSFPGSFSLAANELLATLPMDLPEVSLWKSTVDEPEEPSYIRDFDELQLQDLLVELIDSAKQGSRGVVFTRERLYKKLKAKIQASIESGKFFRDLEAEGMKLTIIPFNGRSFCVSE
jgi:hypothetical protein